MTFYEIIKFINEVVEKGEILYSPAGDSVRCWKNYKNAQRYLKHLWITKQISTTLYETCLDYMAKLYKSAPLNF